MKLTNFIIASGLMFLIAACSSVSVTTDHDPSQDFIRYKSYKIYDGDPIPNDALEQHPLVKRRVYSAIDNVMRNKGFQKAESDDADFMIVAHAGVSEKMRVDNYSGYRGYGWYDPWWGPYGGYTSVSYYDEGSLVIDVVDVQEKELSWRGIGTGVLSKSSSVEDSEKMVNEWVTKILANFPPGREK
jgi:hypothetical protein